MKPYTVPTTFSIATMTLLIIVLAWFAIAHGQTAIIAPNGGYLCGQVGSTQFCGSTTPQDGFSILPLGKSNTYVVTPMAPVTPQYDTSGPSRPSSTPFSLGPSQANPERSVEADQSKTPCYNLFREC